MASYFVPSVAIFHVHLRDIWRTVTRVRDCFISKRIYGAPAVIKQVLAVGSDGVILDNYTLQLENNRESGQGGCTHAIGYLKIRSATTGRYPWRLKNS